MNRVRMFALALSMGLVLGLPASAGAGDDLYFFTISDEVGLVGGTAEVEITFDFADGDSLAGYSMAVCHDIDFVSVTTDDIVNGTAVDDMDIFLHLIAARGDDGWTVGAAFEFDPPFLLDPEDDLQMYLVTYELLAQGDALLEWCELGDPLVENTVLDPKLVEIKEDGALGVTDGSINITKEPFFDFHAENVIGKFDPTTGEIKGVDCTFEDDSVDPPVEVTVTTVLVEFSVEEDPDTSPGFPTDIDGLSMAVHHDGDIFTVCSLQAAGAMADMRGGQGPGFVGVNIRPKETAVDCDDKGHLRVSGWTVGVVFDFMGNDTLAFDGDTVVMSANYGSTTVDSFFDVFNDVTVDLVFATGDNPLGCPTVENNMITDGGGISFDLLNEDLRVNDGSITMKPVVDLEFRRGDCNDDGIINIADAIFALNARFQPPGQTSPLPACFEACDVNDDGSSFEAVDAIFLLNYQFLEGPPPPAPFPDCDFEEEAPCDEYDSSCE